MGFQPSMNKERKDKGGPGSWQWCGIPACGELVCHGMGLPMGCRLYGECFSLRGLSAPSVELPEAMGCLSWWGQPACSGALKMKGL